MAPASKPLVISAPDPRSIDLISTEPQKALLFETYEILEVDPEDVDALPPETAMRVRYVIGQPPLSLETLEEMTSLRCVFNVESNLMAVRMHRARS